MIAKILPKSSSFNAILYNETKVSEGVAELLEMNGLGVLEAMGGDRTAEATRRFFMEYSRSNDRIKYPQFHAVLSCKGESVDKTTLLAMAKDYMAEMGYDLSKTPYMVYFHRDTDNNHVHVITSRVGADGRKVDDSNERIRSQKAIAKAEGVDMGEKAKADIRDALSFKFETKGQFMAVMESMGYECYEQEENLNVKKGGTVLAHIPMADVLAAVRKKIPENAKRTRQLQQIFRKYHNLSTDKDEFTRAMREQFGISLVFVGKKDSPYGYMAIDNRFKTVYKGSDIMKLKDLLTFAEAGDRKKAIAQVIANCLEANPKTTTATINSILRRQFGTGISSGCVKVGRSGGKNTVLYLPHEVTEKLRFNDRVAWIQKFTPTSETERDVLTSLFKVSPSDMTVMSPESKTVDRVGETVEAVKAALEAGGDARDALNENRIILYQVGKEHVAVDMARHTIVTLSDYGVTVTQVEGKRNVKDAPARDATARLQHGGRVGGGQRLPHLPSAPGQASDSVNYNPEDGRKTDWSRLAGEDGLSR